MAAYRRVYDSRHLQADCQEPGSAPEPYARQSSMCHIFLLYAFTDAICLLTGFVISLNVWLSRAASPTRVHLPACGLSRQCAGITGITVGFYTPDTGYAGGADGGRRRQGRSFVGIVPSSAAAAAGGWPLQPTPKSIPN